MRSRSAVITGAAQGNGAAIAKGFAAAGIKVALADLKMDALERVRDEIEAAGGTAFVAKLDVADPDTAKQFAIDVKEARGPVSILVNNAGIDRGGATTLLSVPELFFLSVV